MFNQINNCFPFHFFFSFLLLTVTHRSIHWCCGCNRFFYTVFMKGGGEIPMGAALLARLLPDLLFADVCDAAAFLISSRDALCGGRGRWFVVVMMMVQVSNCVKKKWSETFQLVTCCELTNYKPARRGKNLWIASMETCEFQVFSLRALKINAILGLNTSSCLSILMILIIKM